MNHDQETWPKKAIIEKNSNRSFLTFLRSKEKSVVIYELKNHHQNVFSQTNCLSCANCCKTTPALLTKEDINRISRFLRIGASQFQKQYVIQDINNEYVFHSVPCVFLQNDNTCKVYEVRPQACRRFPHTDEDDYIYHTKMNLENTIICPAAYKILEELKKVFVKE
jgi:hypothetical protein